MFILRRLSYVIIAMIDWPIRGYFLHITFLIWTSVFYQSWIAHVKPFNSSKLLRLEMINEAILLFMCYHLFCFTDLTSQDSQVQVIMYSFLISIALLIAINLFSLGRDIYTALRTWHTRMNIVKA